MTSPAIRLRAVVVACTVGFVACVMAGCAATQSNKKVVIDGREVRVDDAADQAYAEAKKKQTAGDLAGARLGYERIVREFQGAAKAADAQFELGDLAFRDGNFQEAKKAFAAFLLAAPTHELAPKARRLFSLSAIKLGDFRDAVETLKTAVREAEGDEKRELLARLAEAAAAIGDGAATLRALAGQLELAATEAEKQELRQRILAAIDQNMTVTDLTRLVDEVRSDRGVLDFAFESLLFKLARVQLHVGDAEAARKSAQEVLQRFGGGPLAAGAATMVSDIDQRRQVKANAVGVVLPLTGSGSRKEYAQSSLAAIKLAFEGSPVELVVRDSAGEAEKAQQAVEELAGNEHVIAILGPLFSEESLAAAARAEGHGVPLINLSRQDGIPQMGPNVFRLCLTQKQQVQALAKLMVDVLGYKRFAILYPNLPFGVELANLFWDEIDARKGEIRGIEAFDHDQTTFMTPVKKLVGRYYLEARADLLRTYQDIEKDNKNAPAIKRQRLREQALKSLAPVTDFDALFIPGNAKQVGYIAPALAFEDVIVATDKKELEKIIKTTGRDDIKPVRLIGASGWNSPQTVERGGKFVEGAIFVDGFFAADPDARVQKFVQRFRDATKAEPALPDAQAYDAAALLREVLVKSPASRDELRRALEGLKDFAGVTGKITFDKDGEAQKELYMLTIEKGQIVPFEPSKAGG